MEFTTKEFAAELNCSTRTLEGWRISRNGKSPVLPPDHYKDGRAVYTDEQLAVARARLNKSVPETKKENPSIDSEQSASDETPTEITTSLVEEIQVDFTADTTELVTLEERVERIREINFVRDKFNAACDIAIGRELIEAKKEIGHGGWSNWLQENFQWTQQTANKFMRVAARFGNGKLKNVFQFQRSQLQALLALPVGDEEAFIDEQIAKGKPIESQSARKIQENVKEWNERRKPETSSATDNKCEDRSDDSPVEVSIGEKAISGKAVDEAQDLLNEIGALIRTADSQFLVPAIEQLRTIRDALKSKKIARDDEQ